MAKTSCSKLCHGKSMAKLDSSRMSSELAHCNGKSMAIGLYWDSGFVHVFWDGINLFNHISQLEKVRSRVTNSIKYSLLCSRACHVVSVVVVIEADHAQKEDAIPHEAADAAGSR